MRRLRGLAIQARSGLVWVIARATAGTNLQSGTVNVAWAQLSDMLESCFITGMSSFEQVGI